MSLKILIADDEPEILEITAKKISEKGYIVVTAADGEEAWQKIQNESPDIIILDLNMPQKNGFEVLQELREHPLEEKWQPVIIVSARTEVDDVKKGLSLEADHYIVKPCLIEDILKAIRLMTSLIPQHKSPSEMKKDE
ncbi:MAG: response regulator [Candidatus Omnitrophica bacterium]|nr:response regulator [Candidatus Omnitrophota bacterium]MCK5083664.1 response regulator [Candidatus Omnitrophota bacterium]